MLQFIEFCRLCAQKKRHKFDLFANDDDESQELLNKITLCLSVHITKEDILPKMVCKDCQRSIEQFSSFKIKCHKAEERLMKMATYATPNKVLLTRIKEECSETDFNEDSSINMSYIEEDDPKTLANIKPFKNVKVEVYESDDTHQGVSPNIVQIISEEIVNHNNLSDIKEPIIELISEDFVEDFKNRCNAENEENSVCDIKMIGSNNCIEELQTEQNNHEYIDQNAQGQIEISDAIIEIKMQNPETKCEQSNCNDSIKKTVCELEEGVNGVKKINKKFHRKKNKKQAGDVVENDMEIDQKYLVLGENEECDIDIDEMDAIIKKKNDPSARLCCNHCKKSFKLFKCWKKHRTVHENECEPFICDICFENNDKFFKFSSFKCLKIHILRKHLQIGSERFNCEVCGRTLMTKKKLNAHFKNVHNTLGACCQVCGKNFKNETGLRTHLKVHKEHRPYVCSQCGRSFKRSHGLKVHIQSHEQEKNFLCSECGKKFSTKNNLLEHVNIHTGKRPHICEFCNATFVHLSAYSKHLFIHNEKLYKCDKCDKTFSHGHLFNKHKFYHSGLRPYSCSVCLSTFRSQSDLCTHNKIHQEKRYVCSICGRKFSRSGTLKDHMVRHTGIKHICPVPGCGKTYTQRFPLTKHFCKNHPSYKIINRIGRKKKHFLDGVITKQDITDRDYIRYEYKSMIE